jgi:hypothetical protein
MGGEMPQLLTTNAQIKCVHGGTGSVPSPLAPLMTVSGGTVLVDGDKGTIAGCALVQAPCVSFTLRSMGYNATTIDGHKAILVTDFQQTSTMLPLLLTETHNAIDDSTVAPLTAGSPAPPLSAQMLDVVSPVVVAAPPALAFNHVTQLPPLATFVFTVSSAFPRQWMLTHVSASGAEDLTMGGVPGQTVIPAGGDWSTPLLAVIVILTTPYLNALSPGVHEFYLTAVSQRGLPATRAAKLTVA